MAGFYDDNADLRWYIDKGIDWAPLVRLTEYDGRAEGAAESLDEALATYREILTYIGEFAADAIAPQATAIDRNKPELSGGEVIPSDAMQNVFEGLKELDLYGMCLPRELGGMNLPFVLYLSSIELIGRADVSVVAHYGFHGGIAMALLLYSVMEGTTDFDADAAQITATRFAEAIEEIRTGDTWGSMDITEPDAGSDMGALRCKAVQDDDGAWRVTGPKIYITSGHGRWHVVIARTEEAKEGADAFDGLKGLSLFLVPAWTDEPDGSRTRHAQIVALEDKLGHHGSATVALAFEDAPGELIGARGEGFKQMLLLMNNARIGVGFECLGLCEQALRMAKDYAATRASMGKTIDRHEMIADYLDEMQSLIHGIRAIAFDAAVHEETAQKLNLKLRFFPPESASERKAIESERAAHQRAARKLTPLVKYLAAESAVYIARMNVQIHGGAGYIRDYGAEKLLRDAMVMPIYEGTSQIQGLMATKDVLLGVIKRPGDFVKDAAAARFRAVSGSSEAERRVARLQVLQHSAVRQLIQRIAGDKIGNLRGQPLKTWGASFSDWDPKTDFAPALLHAERLIRLLTDVAVAEVLLKQSKQDPSRAPLLATWLERAEPRCQMLHSQITRTGGRILDSLAEGAAADQAAK